jgi:hypothetical protein
MIQKHLIRPERLRRLPKQFSWVDHRLVRDRHIELCSHASATLYLFLVTVADHQGLSYYSDPSLMSRLGMDGPSLKSARQHLVSIGLIAYERPLYQVLSLEPLVQTDHPQGTARSREPMDEPAPIGEIFKRLMGESA